jgi:hypothetical protein
MHRTIFALVILCSSLLPAVAAPAPAVLFVGEVHASYVAQPLHAQGLEVDVCPAGQLAARLATGKYNVVVVSTMNDADRQTVDGFLAAGGGVFVTNPEGSFGNTKNWDATNEWLTRLGARPRWELLQDTDKDNVVRDVMGCTLSYSTAVLPPVNQGVRGVLTLLWNSTGGCEPPMSLDFGPDWTVVVRGAPSMQGKAETRNDPPLQPWIPKTLAAPSPALMGIRQVGPGRLAVVGIRSDWLFHSPGDCPTAENMLTKGAGGKPSDWLLLFANTFRWLASPSLEAGQGGATTPDAVLHPPVTIWPIQPVWDWSKWSAQNPTANEPQNAGLVGAQTELSSGTGTVADYVKAARAAKLQFVVFLENSLKMDQGKWDQLVAQCKANSDDNFLCVPGLTYEDAQFNHHYAFDAQTKFPKPAMLLPDGRLATTQVMRSRAYFDYENEYNLQEDIRGFWDHAHNFLPPADYKLYDSFPIYSFIDGKQVDDDLPDYLYLQGLGGNQAVLALEFMTSPTQVADRAAHGWRVITRWPLADLDKKWSEGAWAFGGTGMQYITNGPQILVWDTGNLMAESHGEWWRPDLWEYRLRLRVASPVGLRTVTIYDGDREIFRQWRPAGAKQFEDELILANCQQRGLTLVVEDAAGHRAISMSYWNRNLVNEQVIESDRCNFNGDSRLRTRAGVQVWTPVGFESNMGITPSKGSLHLLVSPSVWIGGNAPTLPIDGAPSGHPYSFYFGLQIPGELRYLYAYSQVYLIGPEIAISQADIKLGFDPAEEGAKTAPNGFPYQQPQVAAGGAWDGWYHLIPTLKVTGWERMAACTWLTEGFRLGWQETNLTAKEAIAVPAQGIQVTYFKGELWQDGKKIGSYDSAPMTGPFGRGTFATLEDTGGAVVLIGMGDNVVYDYNQGNLTLYYKPKEPVIAAGGQIHYTVAFAGGSHELTTDQMVEFAQKFGVATPGKPGYTPTLTHGKLVDNYLIWRLDGEGTGITATVPKTEMPGFLPVCVQGLNDNWSVVLWDKSRSAPNNTRALPIRGGEAWAQLDLNEADSDLFIGHPVVASQPQVKLLVAWQEPGVWCVEANNPTAKPLPVTLDTAPGWTVFSFHQTLTLAPGTSQTWQASGPGPAVGGAGQTY